MSAQRQRTGGNVSASTLVANDPAMMISPIYPQLLSPEGVIFLFASRFSSTLQEATSLVANAYNVTTEQAIEEFR
jgi:hypothetical protein